MEFFAPDLFVILVVAMALIASVRVLREDQRATAWLLGRTLVVKGPGLVLRIPGLHQRWQGQSIGNRGVMLENAVRIDEDGDHVYVFVDHGSALCIPSRAFDSGDARKAFIDEISRRIRR